MAIGIGIVLLVLGAIFAFALEVSVPGLGENALGLILLGAGVLSIILGMAQTHMWTNRRTAVDVEERRVDAGSGAARRI